MPLDTSLIQGMKQLEIPNAVDQYANMLGLQMGEIRNDNALAKGISDQKTAELTHQKMQGEIEAAELAKSRELLATVQDPEQFIAWHNSNHSNPVLKGYFQRMGVTPEQSNQQISSMIQAGRFQELLTQSKIGVEKAMENHFYEQNTGDKTRMMVVRKYGKNAATMVPDSEAVIKKSPNAPQTTINIDNKGRTSYAQTMGKQNAIQDAALQELAKKAPDLVTNSQEIIDLVDAGKVFTGTGATVKLQLAKALNMAGGSDTEKIKNTENLISSMQKTTLAAIKGSGLGSGQGFSNKDLDFLEKSTAGQITSSPENIKRLAEINRRVGIRSAEAWNKRIDTLDQEIVNGAQLQKVEVPKVKNNEGKSNAVGRPWEKYKK